MKVNFKEFKVYTDLKKTKSNIIDFQDQLAEFIYENGGGFKALRLATKIADGGEDGVELTNEETQMILTICDNSNMFCYLAASLHELLDNKEE